VRNRIFKSFSALIVIAILLTFAAMEYISYQDAYSNMQEWAVEDAKLLSDIISAYGTEALNDSTAGSIEGRVTLIDKDGTVLYESDEDSSVMENHLERPEVQEAIANGSGSAARLSETFGKQSYYYALKLSDGSVIRVSRTMDTVASEVLSRIGIAIGLILLLFLLEMFLARSVTNRIVEPINRLDLEHPLKNSGPLYEELDPLLHRIDEQNTQIRIQMEALKKEQEQYLAITENMQDGLIVTDLHNVLSINRAAQKLFDVSPEECVGHTIHTVSHDKEMSDALKAAGDGENYENTFEKGSRSYQIHGAPVKDPETGDVYGAVILTMDVTEREQAETLRKEFSANVSHELKTPLMSISGYAELIETGLARQEDVKDFASRIHSEASRLKNLVDDIIRLSRLEEAGSEIQKEEIPLDEICQDVYESLSDYAKEHNVTFTIEKEPVSIMGSRQTLFEMVYNLCDNGIKYNRENGKVTLSLKKENGSPVITVKDTGIGIAKEHQERIFERFYRVDKSHSRETGGTGLGLSIVKHGALLHNAEIEMKSVLNKGTEIRLIFPKQ